VSEHPQPPEQPPVASGPEQPVASPTRQRTVFEQRLTIATLSLLFVVLVVYLLTQYATILQPLLIATFIIYAVAPVHQWLVEKRVPSLIAYVLILAFTLGIIVGMGTLVLGAVQDLASGGLQVYEEKLDQLAKRTLERLPGDLIRQKERDSVVAASSLGLLASPGGYGPLLVVASVPSATSLNQWRLRDLIFTGERKNVSWESTILSLIGGSVGFLTSGFIIFIYLVFIMAEKASFSQRLGAAFGQEKASRYLNIAASVNRAIAAYISVKTWVSLLTGLLSLCVLWPFGVRYFALWSLLIFLFNYIPYIGSLVAVLIPVVLSFLQFDTLWQPLVISVLLIGVQQFTGNIIEPRLTGKRLDVSPVLVLASLAFWGAVWGITGMILAVPLTVIAKIILENIQETRPIATLMSNQ
jgi:AI-2 transport protein TqsA